MRTLVIPDTHAPYQHHDCLGFLKRCKRRFRPDVVVHIGDLGDQHRWSRHKPEPDAMGPREEDEACREFCRELYSLFPVVKACVGNHDARLAKACVRAGLPSRLHLTVAEMYESPEGWQWAHHWEGSGVAFFHGEGFSGKDCALKAAIANRCNTVVGHIHSAAGVMYSAGPLNTVWGMSVGCLIDPHTPAFTYGKATAAKPVLGCGAIIDGVPHFEPYH